MEQYNKTIQKMINLQADWPEDWPYGHLLKDKRMKFTFLTEPTF